MLMLRRTIYAILLSVLVLSLSCKEDVANRPFVNQSPKTFLWLYPDSTVGIGVSRQHLRWWGEDPDGLIRGYLFAFGVFPNHVTRIPTPDTLRYTFVTSNDTTILFPLDTLFRNFTVFVRAVDNGFRSLNHQSIVRMSPTPFWDKNDNGVFDPSVDVLLPDLTSSVDPMGAVQTFPVRNTPPTIVFAMNPYSVADTLKQPDTTYTVATFAFKGSDPDGDNTLAKYRIALNDSSSGASWLELPTRDTIVTLVVPRGRSDSAGSAVDADVYGGASFLSRRLINRLPGLRLDALNKLYVKVRDVAGEYSRTIALPRGTDIWYVKRPRGRILLVKDYLLADSSLALSTYLTSLAAVPGGQFTTADQIDIDRGLSVASKDPAAGAVLGALTPPFIDPALTQTMLLYDYVFWYTEQYPSLWIARQCIFPYIQNGGKVLFSTMFLNSNDPRGALRDFAPIDSISSVDLGPSRPPAPPAVRGDTRIPGGFILYPDSSDPGNIYPQLAFSNPPLLHTLFMREIYKRSDAHVIYRLQDDPRGRYIGYDPLTQQFVPRPTVAVVDGLRTIIFVGLPLHLLNNPTLGSGVVAFFTKIFGNEFDLHHRIDRRKF